LQVRAGWVRRDKLKLEVLNSATLTFMFYWLGLPNFGFVDFLVVCIVLILLAFWSGCGIFAIGSTLLSGVYDLFREGW